MQPAPNSSAASARIPRTFARERALADGSEAFMFISSGGGYCVFITRKLAIR
jgi:hypothetical protein